jgi:NADH:ubiquinone oxidoreductase subunit 4 (subunit M)
MNDRTKNLWLPGLAVFAASMIWMMVLQRFNPQVHPSWAHSGLPVSIYLLWLLPQPIFGAIGAYLSRRAGGGYKTGLAASLSPAIVMFVIVCCVIVLGVAIERDPHIAQQPFNIILTFLTWVVLPGVALLCGALPFGKMLSPRSG